MILAFRAGPVRAASLLLLALMLSVASAATARTVQVHVVRDDRGGLISDRVDEIRRLRRSGARVQIRGRVCYSSCTLFLGLPGACVSTRTTFGFHGPSRYGEPLPRAWFDYWSRVMADHYPPSLRHWFMSRARHRIAGMYMVSGQELVRLGVPECDGRQDAP